MATRTISDYFLVDADGTQVSYEVYRTREDAQARIDRAPAEVRDEIAVKEVQTNARFLAVVSNRKGLRLAVEPYMWFGSRIVAEGPNYVVVGASVDYAESQSLRLSSGLLGNRAHPTLEEALADAQEMAVYIYGKR